MRNKAVKGGCFNPSIGLPIAILLTLLIVTKEIHAYEGTQHHFRSQEAVIIQWVFGEIKRGSNPIKERPT